ncbi:hypothetical protein PanWU01x14_225060 [Parasponia andersonii]|uniref:Uncharacterized protein n=1 Tax=Parasponia andersonii TaxID=3476 RepID=A0A2P5BN50_PARAD|nr:hypothetical protein PanWU01x14_225060 [Parasponia andersonii]
MTEDYRHKARPVPPEGLLEAEREAHRKVSHNSSESREKCLEMGTTLFKITQVLCEANEHLRSLEGYLEATSDASISEASLPDVIRID